MYQNYNYYPQAQQQNSYSRQQPAGASPQVYYLKGHPVSSLEEAKASTIDFDGSIFFFPDIANKRIYTKQINLDGTSSFNVYEYKEIPIDKLTTSQYITREEFDNAFAPFKKMLQQVSENDKSEKNQTEFKFS